MASLRNYLGDDLYGDVEAYADASGSSLTETMRRALRLGLALMNARRAGQTILLRANGAEKEVVILE